MQSSSSAASYTGLHWSLAVVRHDGTRVPVPSDWDVYIEFDPSGALLASDSINTMSGRYVPTTTGLRARR